MKTSANKTENIDSLTAVIFSGALAIREALDGILLQHSALNMPPDEVQTLISKLIYVKVAAESLAEKAKTLYNVL